jgi:hypothetical protein
MNRDLERKLQARFPGFFRDLYGDPLKTCMSMGCTFADGWYRLLERLCEELEPVAPPEFRFDQVTEKFGAMRVYTSGGNEETARLILKAREESLRVCEVCGATEGVTTEWKRWFRSLCPSCGDAQDRGLGTDP